MLRRIFRQIRVVQFKCSSVAEGKIYVAYGVVAALLCAVSFAIDNVDEPAILLVIALAAVCSAGFGVYYWKFRRKPLTREVTLGGLGHNMFRRGKWWFAAYAAVKGMSEFIFLMAIIAELIREEESWTSLFVDNVKGMIVLLPFIVIRTHQQYILFRQYALSPQSARKDLFTEATKKR